MTERSAVATPDAPQAFGPYSQAVCVGEWVFASGQLGADPASGALEPGGVGAQTERALRNLRAVLEAAGVGLDRVVKTTVFLTDLARFQEMNEAYARFFPAPASGMSAGTGRAENDLRPARSTVGVSALPKGALVEIEAVARR